MAGTPLELIAVEVRADLDRLESGMNGAVRVVDQSMSRIDRSVSSTERSISVAGANVERSFAGAGGASRVFAQQIGQVGQQVVAGTGILQAFAIQLPDIAAGMGSAGGAAGRFAQFLGGPWGIAITTAISLAAAFIPKILGIGDAADKSKPSIDRLAGAYANLAANIGKADAAGLQAQAKAEIQLRADQTKAAERLKTAEDKLAASKRVDPRGRGSAPLIRDVEEAKARVRELQTAENLVRLSEARRREAQAREASANSAASGGGRTGGGSAASTTPSPARSNSEAEKAERDKQALDARYATTLEQFRLEQQLADIRSAGTLESQAQADKLEVVAQIQRQFPELAASTNEVDKQRLAVLEQIATATIDAAYARRADKEAADQQIEADRQIAAERQRAADDLARRQDQQVRDLASVYEDAFHGGTDAIWRDFKDIGFRAIAEVLAQWTLGQSAPGGGSGGLIGSLVSSIGNIFKSAGGGSLGAGVGFASGGSMVLGGRGGTDANSISYNGREVANVSRGEILTVSNTALRSGSGQTVIHAPQFNLAGAVITRELYADMERISNQSSLRASAASYAQGQQSTPGTLNKYSQLKG
jgi:hypothetical protein